MKYLNSKKRSFKKTIFLGKGLILLFCIFLCNFCPFLSRLFFFVVCLWCICLVIIVNKLEVWWQYLPPTYNVKLGRDSHVMFRFYSFENVASRIVQMCSQVFGPNGDEKCGFCDKWLADSHRRRVSSYISNYKDNRFNSIFLGATELIHHLQI